ncbi:SDR family oxidoreductase [Foetidibacter luteolus]|uniref:SDR family oxidoreductase n=1 Tax=Foetidibacter luteolus TaxID=2608880 RepID=UPI00129AC545|nr:SDR family NAD(P)-dependent oxidoreductase [Foetidibacter luteolus]
MNIIITGASKGLGRAIAEKFAAPGHNLFICSRNEQQLKQTSEELLRTYPFCTINFRPVDMSVAGEVKAFAQWVLDSGFTPDIIVNNAGQFIPGSVHNEKQGVLEKMIEVNLYSAYHLTRYLLPPMMQARSGHIFNICSIASLQAYANGGAYSISKFALAGFSKNLREEMKPYNIKVTAVYPGAAYTDSWSGSGVDPNRIMQANDVAEMVFATAALSPQACVEDIVLRPQLGDL